MMKGKDIKWLVGMIPDDALVTIDGNHFVDVSAVECERHDGVYNLHLTPGYSITKDEVLDGMMAQLRSLCDKIAANTKWCEIPSEKQKEQKPVEPSDDKLQRHQDEMYDFKVFATKQAKEHHISYVHDFEWNNFCAELLSYFAEQKPAEWSEEDEVYLQDALWCVKQAAKVARGENDMGACWSAERWLKSLRPQPHWKPSEEQMMAFHELLGKVPRAPELYDLYNDLEKLM